MSEGYRVRSYISSDITLPNAEVADYTCGGCGLIFSYEGEYVSGLECPHCGGDRLHVMSVSLEYDVAKVMNRLSLRKKKGTE